MHADRSLRLTVSALLALAGGLTCPAAGSSQQRTAPLTAPAPGTEGVEVVVSPWLLPGGIASAPIGSTQDRERDASTLAMVSGGVAGGALGLVVGSYLGMPFELGGSEYFPMGQFLGGVLGESLGLALGVHLANGRRGDYGRSALRAMGVMGAGLLLAVPTVGLSLIAVPPVQLYVSVRTERGS